MLALFEALQYSEPLVAMRASPWLFPAIASVHLLGLAMLGGAVLVVDLRLLGLGLTDQSPAAIGRAAQPWLIGSICVMLPTGVLLFMCFATKYYYLGAFWLKVAALLIVLVFTFTTRRRLIAAVPEHGISQQAKGVAALSITLWVTIALCGRLIGFP
jgi:hypothetical protein